MTEFKTRREKLEIAHKIREQEVEDYQINIDNYSKAMARIDTLSEVEKSDLAEFRAQLADLRIGEIREQRKSQIMFDVLTAQLGETS